jgi:DNA helicase-2/ATP-dependent DNA helicase PcrA
MRFISDLHIHSRFSRATSRDLGPEQLALWGRKKGLTVLGTGDFTHPAWFSELRDKLVSAEPGLYRLRADLRDQVDAMAPRSCPGPTRFVLSCEISCIYKKNGKTRKIHHLILMPDMASVEKFQSSLSRIGNITSDGRPILGLDSRDLLEITLEACEDSFFIPAHIWTPWFSLFGSKSGFDTLEECFEDLSHHIHALETGLSSDPPMNRRLSALDDYVLVSNSDAHSAAKLGREANVFDTPLDYNHMVRSMTTGEGFVGTVEFYPEEGKYHLDGHRKCGVVLNPSETLEYAGVCPACERPLTVGVLHRVHELSDRSNTVHFKDFFSLIPLPEVLSELLCCGPSTKKVATVYEDLLSALGPEIPILMDTPLEVIQRVAGPFLAKAIERMRLNHVIRQAGYDGQYGVIRLFEPSEMEALAGQMDLFQYPSVKASNKAPTTPSQPWTRPRSTAAVPSPRAPMTEDPILGPLNREQRAAVTHGGGHALVTAGPGTGKTMTLTHRIGYLLRKKLAASHQILSLTFTRKAAREMVARLDALLAHGEASPPQVFTFHGFCLEVLRRYSDLTDLPTDFTLCSEQDSHHLARQVLDQEGLGARSTARFLRECAALRSASVVGSPLDDFQKSLRSTAARYRAQLRSLRMLDLDDLELETLRLFLDHPEVAREYGRRLPWIFVDEYQDTNPVQVELIKCLLDPNTGAVFVIGDPDQAIYRFRGADVQHFFRFGQDFPGAREYLLTRNYRSTDTVLHGSAAVMGKDHPLQGRINEGSPIDLVACGTDGEEAEMVVEQIEKLIGGTSYFSLDSGRVESHEGGMPLSFGDIAVLFRLNAQGQKLQEALSRAGIPSIRSGEAPLIQRPPATLLCRFLQTLLSPEHPHYREMYEKAFSGAAGLLKEVQDSFPIHKSPWDLIRQAVSIHGLEDLSDDEQDTLDRLLIFAENHRGDLRSFLDALSLERGIDHTSLLGDRVALMSLHAAKGLQWPVVFITGCENQLLPCSLFGDKDEEEERRLFYVGMTRAKERLILSWTSRRSLGNRVLQMKPSPFLQAIPRENARPLERRHPRPRAHKQLGFFD